MLILRKDGRILHKYYNVGFDVVLIGRSPEEIGTSSSDELSAFELNSNLRMLNDMS